MHQIRDLNLVTYCSVTQYTLALAAVALAMKAGIYLYPGYVTAQQHQLSIAYYTFLVLLLYRRDGNTPNLSWNSIPYIQMQTFVQTMS